MRTMTGVSVAALGTLAVLTGCGGGDDGGSVGLDKLPGAYASAVCKQSFKCCTMADLMEHTMASCQSNTSTALSFALSQVSASQSKGRARYQGDQAGACVAALQNMSCDDWKDPKKREQASPACAKLILPLVDDGKPCGNDVDCKSGFCDGDAISIDNKPPTEGVCKAPAAVGAACTENEGCARGSFCEFASDKCTMLRADGALCDGDDECQGGYCDENTSKCTSQIPVGKCYGGCAVAGKSWQGNAGIIALLLALGVVMARARAGRRARA